MAAVVVDVQVSEEKRAANFDRRYAEVVRVFFGGSGGEVDTALSQDHDDAMLLIETVKKLFWLITVKLL